MNIYVPVEIKARELEGKTLLALAAAERGHDVILAGKEDTLVLARHGVRSRRLTADDVEPLDRKRAYRERPDATSLGASGSQPGRMCLASDLSLHLPVGRLNGQMRAYRCASDDWRSGSTPVHDAPWKGAIIPLKH